MYWHLWKCIYIFITLKLFLYEHNIFVFLGFMIHFWHTQCLSGMDVQSAASERLCELNWSVLLLNLFDDVFLLKLKLHKLLLSHMLQHSLHTCEPVLFGDWNFSVLGELFLNNWRWAYGASLRASLYRFGKVLFEPSDICNTYASFSLLMSHNFHMIMSSGFRARPIKRIISEFTRDLWNDSMLMKIRSDVSCTVSDFCLPSNRILSQRRPNGKSLALSFLPLFINLESVHEMKLKVKINASSSTDLGKMYSLFTLIF